MAGDQTASLVVALSAQVSKFQKDLNDAAGIADKSAKRIEDRFSRIKIDNSGFEELKSTLIGIAGIGGLAETISKVLELTKAVAQIGEVAERVGLTTDQFQSLRFAVVATGGSVETADGFMDRFSQRISEAARGSGELYEVFRANKTALTDSNGTLLSANTLLGKYADLVKNAKSPQDALNLAMMVGGRQAGPEMVDALKQGSDGLQKFADDAKSAGVIVEREMIDRAKTINTEYQKLKLSLTTYWEQIAVQISEQSAQAWGKVKQDATGGATELKSLWQSIGDFVDAHPILKDAFGSSLEQIKTAAALRAQLAGQKNFDTGIALLKGGGGTPLTGAQGFPGYTDAKSGSGGTTVIPNVQAEAFQKLLDAQQRRIDLLGAEREAVGLNVGQATQLRTQIELESRAREQNIPLTAARKQAIADEAARTGAAAQALDDYKRHWQGLNSAVQFAGDQVIDVLDGLRQGTLSSADAVKQLGNAFIHAAEQALLLGSGPLAGLFGTQSSIPGGTGGLLGGLVGLFKGGSASAPLIYGPGFASGTNFAPGGMALVGENGPEVVNLPRGSQVIPNSVTRNMGGGGIVVNISSNPVFQAGMTPTDMAAIDSKIAQNGKLVTAATIQAIRSGNSRDSNFLR